jgi:hypothetical protein
MQIAGSPKQLAFSSDYVPSHAPLAQLDSAAAF